MIKFISYVRPAGSGQIKSIPVVHTALQLKHRIHSKEDLQQICVTWANLNLELAEYRVHHTYPMCFDYHKSRKMGVRKGFPDLWISLGEGKTGYIVFLYKQSLLTLEQENFRDFLKSEGHQWAVCRSLEDFIHTLKEWGLTSKYQNRAPENPNDLFKNKKMKGI